MGGRGGAHEFFGGRFSRKSSDGPARTHPDFPVTVYYAFKQQDTSKDGKVSTGWETLLEGMIQSGWQITATWPMRSGTRQSHASHGTNALASLHRPCLRPRPEDAPRIDRRGFTAALKAELPQKLRELQQGSIAPWTDAAAIGPGMTVFSRYSRVMNDDGSPMTVRSALQRINVILDEVPEEMVNDFDDEIRYALTWFRLRRLRYRAVRRRRIQRHRPHLVGPPRTPGIPPYGGGKVALIAHA